MKAVLSVVGWIVGDSVTKIKGRIRIVLAIHHFSISLEEFLLPIPKTLGSMNSSAGCYRENASTRGQSKGPH